MWNILPIIIVVNLTPYIPVGENRQNKNKNTLLQIAFSAILPTGIISINLCNNDFILIFLAAAIGNMISDVAGIGYIC